MLRIVEAHEMLCRVYQTTKGMHFIFMNNGRFDRCRTKINLACGIVADIKVGLTNSIEVLKFGGKEREIIYDIFDDEEYGRPPAFLAPVPCKTDFSTLRNGDGRNQSLFNYILTLQSNDFSKEEAREAIRIMNKYVLPESLEDDELETILRDESFKKPVFYTNKQFRHDKFARYLLGNCHIKRINGQLHVYEDGVYRSGEAFIESEMIKHIPDLNRAKRAEVMAYLEILCRAEVEPAPAQYIAFKNGILNLETMELMDFTPNIVITNKINYDYVPGAYHELCDKTLNKMACHDKEIRALLDEAVGYCFYRRNELRKCFMLTGEKQNGKSTFLAMLEHLLKGNTTSLDLRELGERFKTAQLHGKLANIGDDIGEEFIPNSSVFKKLVSGNTLNVENKGAKPFDFSSYAKLLFSANNIPRLGKGRDSAAVMSRLIIIPFDARFTVNDPDFDPYIKYKLITDECMHYLIQCGITGLKRVLENQSFTKSAKVAKQLEEYEENSNPVLLFFKEEPKIENEPTAHVFREYCGYCATNGFTPMSNVEFSKQVNRYLHYTTTTKSVNGKKQRVFVKL